MPDDTKTNNTNSAKNQEQGFIKLFRSFHASDFWRDSKPFDKARAWIDLIFRANWKSNVWNSITIERGELITSIQRLALDWGWSRGKVKRFLETLKNEQKTDSKRTANGQQTDTSALIITILNYEDYQGSQKANGQQMIDKRSTDEQKTDTLEEIRNKKRSITKVIDLKHAYPFGLSAAEFLIPPVDHDSGLPPKMIEEFKRRGCEEVGQNVWIPPAQYAHLCARFSDSIVAEAVNAMSDWSVSFAVSPKTKQPGWLSYRQKTDHYAVCVNQIKRNLKGRDAI